MIDRRLIAAAACAVIVVLGLLVWQYNRAQYAEEKHRKAVILTQQQAQNINTLQGQLGVSQQAAEEMAATYQKAIAGKIAPVYVLQQEADTEQKAAGQVAAKINAKDNSLPPGMLKEWDRTIIVPCPGNKYAVGVYQTNLQRNWDVSAGVGVHGGDKYIPVEITRNYSKDRAVSVEYHAAGRETGCEVKYHIKTNKLFILF